MRRILLMATTVFGLLVIANTSFADHFHHHRSPYHGRVHASYHARAYAPAYAPAYGCQPYGYHARHHGYGAYDYVSPRAHHRRYASPYGYHHGGGVSVRGPRFHVGVRW